MGHSEMLLAVAGMTEEEIAERTARLGAGDWSGFPVEEQVAFAFARKLTAEPWSVDDADVALLEATFGRRRALDIVWHVAWGNYMMRFADALQLPLESVNVFQKQKEEKDAKEPAKP